VPQVPTAPIAGTVVQPTCSVATGSVELTGLPTGNWTINGTAGTGSTYTVSGLAPGTYTYTVTNADGCTSTASANVTINAAPNTPSAPIVGTVVQPTCSVATGSVELTGLPTGNWTINGTAGTGSTYTVSGLAPGTYTYTVINADGCTSTASANVTINAAPNTPASPIVGTVVQPTCSVATGSVELTGLPAGNWTINGTINGTGSTYTVTGLAAGLYSYTVTNAEGCTSSASANVTINTAIGAPTAPVVGTVTQPTCLVATGSIELTGLPAGNWTINGTAGTGSTYTVSGLAPGAYSFSVTNAGGCISSLSAEVVLVGAGETINSAVTAKCNLIPDTIDLGTLTGAPTGGQWFDLDNSNALQGSVFNPLNVPVGNYTINYVVADGGCTKTFTIEVTVGNDCVVESPCPITVYNAFSPDGDGENEVFVIDGIEVLSCFPTNSVEIYNRWGVLVFETKQYDNNTRAFRGISEGRVNVGSEKLPTGTYFYILKYVYQGQNKEKTGYLYLSKK